MVEPQDLDILKDIPGYKAIFRALIKSQIQHLVEQLSCHTDEECVLLTASLTDGTLTHLGSSFGKQFLDSHDDVKKQFLGFCLKRQLKTSSSPDNAWSVGEASMLDTTMNKSATKPGLRAKRNRAAASPYADLRQNKHFTTQGKTRAENNSIRHRQETSNIESELNPESHTQVFEEDIKVELSTSSDGISHTDTEQTGFHPNQFGGFNLEPENQTGSSSANNNVSEGILNDSTVAVKLEPVNEEDEDLVLTHVEMNAAAGTVWGNQSVMGEQLSESVYHKKLDTSFTAFREILVEDMMDDSCEVPLSGRDQEGNQLVKRLPEHHFPEHIIPREGARIKYPLRDCKFCNKKAKERDGFKRRQSRYLCKKCNAPLCVPDCFIGYHKQHFIGFVNEESESASDSLNL